MLNHNTLKKTNIGSFSTQENLPNKIIKNYQEAYSHVIFPSQFQAQNSDQQQQSSAKSETEVAIIYPRVAILVSDGFEESELFNPMEALVKAGIMVEIISPENKTIQGFNHLEKGKSISPTRTIKQAMKETYDALYIPGGLFSPDALRTNPDALQFVEQFFAEGKPVGAICHGPQVLISANVVKGRSMTCVQSIQDDLKNAGAEVEDIAVMVDNGLVTSRQPDDLNIFCHHFIKEVNVGFHIGQREQYLKTHNTLVQ